MKPEPIGRTETREQGRKRTSAAGRLQRTHGGRSEIRKIRKIRGIESNSEFQFRKVREEKQFI